MIKQTLLGLSASAMLFLAGCGAQPGTSVVKYDYEGPVHKAEAPSAGTYALYSKFGTNPDVTYELKRGDTLGFVEEDGKIYAVAGDHKDLVKAGFMSGYYWKMKP